MDFLDCQLLLELELEQLPRGEKSEEVPLCHKGTGHSSEQSGSFLFLGRLYPILSEKMGKAKTVSPLHLTLTSHNDMEVGLHAS